MKKRLCQLLVAVSMILVGCAPAIDIASTPTQSTLVTPSPSSSPDARATQIVLSRTREAEARLRQTQIGPSPTRTPGPTRTATPTRTPTPYLSPTVTQTPTITITPIAVNSVQPHVLALNAVNAAIEMKRLAALGLGSPHDLAWSPEGQYLAVATGNGVVLYDTVSLEKVRQINVNQLVSRLALSPDGQVLALSRSTTIETWNVATGRKMMEMEGTIQGGIWKIVYGKMGHIAAYGQQNPSAGERLPELKIWNASTGGLLYHEDRITGGSTAVDISPDGKTIVYWGNRGLTFMDLPSLKVTMTLDRRSESVLFNADGTKVYSTGMRYWDVAPPLVVIDTQTGEMEAIEDADECFSLLSSERGIFCFGDLVIHQIAPLTSAVEKTITAPERIYRAAANPHGDRFAYINSERLRVFEVANEQEVLFQPFGNQGPVAAGIALMGTEARYIAAAGGTFGTVQIWDLMAGEMVRTAPISEAALTSIAISPDQRTLATIDQNHSLRLYDLLRDTITIQFAFPQSIDGPLVVSPDGKRIAMTDQHQENIFELDLQSGDLEKRGEIYLPYAFAATLGTAPYFYTADSHLHSFRIEPDTNRVAYVDLTEGTEEIIPFDESEDLHFIEAVSASPDGSTVAIATAYGNIYLWNRGQVQVRTIMTGHEQRGADGWMGSVRRLQFSPTSNLLVSIGYDDTIRFWNIRTENMIRQLNICCSAQFTPDGRLLVINGYGGIQVWGLPPFP